MSATPKIAVLIDGDNIGPKFAPRLFNHIGRLGEPILRRVYVNAASTGIKWSSAVSTQSLLPVHVLLIVAWK